jgi:IPT/TIG domain-containing protein
MRVITWVSTIAAIGLLTLGVSAHRSGDESDLKLCVLDEKAPAGGMVQMKVVATEVTPISGGRPGFAFDAGTFGDVAGFGIFAPNGEAAGAAIVDGNHVQFSYVTSSPAVGEYPVLTVTLSVRSDAPVGFSTPFDLDPASLWFLGGTFARARINPGTFTVGGSVAVGDVLPAEGLQPAGTVVSIRGVGFNTKTRVRIQDVAAAVRFVDPTEIRATLGADTNMTGQRVQAVNPDGSTSTYYAYTHAGIAARSARTLLGMTEPVFSGATHTVATLGPLGAMSGAQYAGLALQNSTSAPVSIRVDLRAEDGTLLHSTNSALPARGREALAASELLDGLVPPERSFIMVTASAPIHVAALICDESTWTVTPLLPISRVHSRPLSTGGGGA